MRQVGSFSFNRAALSPLGVSSTPTPALGAQPTADEQMPVSTAAAAAPRSQRSLHAGALPLGPASQSHTDDAFCSPGAPKLSRWCLQHVVTPVSCHLQH